MKSLLLVLAVFLTSDGPEQKDSIQGGWTVVLLSSNGYPKEVKTNLGVRIDEKHIKEGNDAKYWVGYTLNTAVSPKQIDLTNGQKGIFELDGDELRICYSTKERPTDFQGGVRVHLKRNK